MLCRHAKYRRYGKMEAFNKSPKARLRDNAMFEDLQYEFEPKPGRSGSMERSYCYKQPLTGQGTKL